MAGGERDRTDKRAYDLTEYANDQKEKLMNNKQVVNNIAFIYNAILSRNFSF
jgi:hypothetical protein